MTLQANEEGKLINTQTSREVLPIEVSGGVQSVHVPITQTSDTRRTEAVIRPHIVPIIFLPGIMGSNLKAQSSQKESEKFNQYLWKTPRFEDKNINHRASFSKEDAKEIIKASRADKADKVWCVSNLATLAASKIWRSPATRAKTLNPENISVDYNPKLKKGPGIFDADPDIDLAIALIRGWGSVSQTDYWPVMSMLQKALNQPYQDMIQPYMGEDGDKTQTPTYATNKDGSQDLTQKLPFDPAAQVVGQVPLVGSMLDWNNRQRNINQIEALSDRIWTSIKKAGDNNPPYASFNLVSQGNGILGSDKPKAFKKEQVQKAASYHFRVYGGGYNWLNSNAFSANSGDESKGGSKRVKENDLANPDTEQDYTDCLSTVVDTILASIKEQEDYECDKVILVTHSMGGLVGRAYAAKHPDKVLGVVHGVMPATCAAAMYKRMRAGFGGVETSLVDIEGLAVANVLGDDGAKVSAVLTHSVGGLELAPSDSYADPIDMAQIASQLMPNEISHKITALIKANTHQWLQVQNTAGQTVLALPTNPAKVYDMIYQSQAWYGLIPIVKGLDDGDSGTDNPLGFHNQRVDPAGEFNYKHPFSGILLGDFAYFSANVMQAKKYHTSIAPKGFYHPNTYAQCMVAGKESVHRAFNRVVFTATNCTDEDLALLALNPDDWDLTKDTLVGGLPRFGGLRLQNKTTGRTISLTLKSKDLVNDWGDGTVPAVSGLAPAPYVKALFEQHDNNPDYDHQGSWKMSVAHLFALCAITQIIQEDTREAD